jgi:biopolymer transport protein ExbD
VNLLLLEQTLQGMLQGRPAKIAYLRADERLRYGKVIEVVDKMKRAGVEQIGFVYVLPSEKKTP